MTEVEKLRALLAEARREHDGDANVGACGTDNDGGDTRCDRCKRIDAALAEPVATVIDWRSFFLTAERERDEARAEVERLGRLLTDSTVIIRETVQILASVVRQINGGEP